MKHISKKTNASSKISDKISPNKKKESIHSSAFPDSFQFPGKIASNRIQILIFGLINIVLNITPIYMLRSVVLDDM